MSTYNVLCTLLAPNSAHCAYSLFSHWYRWQTTLNSAVEECKEKDLKCGKEGDDGQYTVLFLLL